VSRRFLILVLLLIVSAIPGAAQTNTTPPPTTGALLVWIGEGNAPENRAANSSSQLAALLPNGTLATLIEFDERTVGVQRCSGQPFSADGRRFAFFASQPAEGGERGTLYQMTDFGAPATIGVTHTLTCAHDHFAYSPDGARLAYIDFQQFGDADENVMGTLRVLNTDSLVEQGRFERATSFTFTDTELLFLQFFPNADNAVDEVAISAWDGTASREVSAITARANCRFSGGEISPAGDGFIAVLLGERCRGNARSRWQIYLVDREARSSTLVASAEQPGGYFPATQTYNLYSTAGGEQAVFSFADGLTRNTASIYQLDFEAPDTPVVLVDRAAIMRRYVPLRFSLPDIAPAARSRDGNFWAVSVNPPGSSELVVIDFNALDATIRIPVTRTGDAVRAMAFTPDSSTLVYVAGGLEGADTSLYHLDMTLGVENRVARGQFAPAIAVRADAAAALVQYRMTSEATPRPYTDLVLVEADGAQRDLLGGIVLDEQGFFVGFRYIVPLAWR
jgi:hypothetical protein